MKDERIEASKLYEIPAREANKEGLDASLANLEKALASSILLTYAQGFAQLRAASAEYGYGLNLEIVAKVWRAGCIIRSASLEKIRAAYGRNPELKNLLLDQEFAAQVLAGNQPLRSFIGFATRRAVPIPCFSASLAYFDSYRTEILPANLIQAQRDYFGAHGYERTDKPGAFHTPDWDKD